AQGLPDTLMAQADSQERDPGSEPRDHLAGDPRLQRRARARRDDQPARLYSLDLVQGDLVGADDSEGQSRIDLGESLEEVVRERIVIIDQEDHASLVLGPWSSVCVAG